MPPLDVPTLLAVTAAVYAALAATMALASRETPAIPGLRPFPQALGLVVAGSTLRFLEGRVPDFGSILAANLLLVAGAARVLEGVRLLYRRNLLRRLSGSVLGGASIALTYHLYLDPSVNARIVASSLALAVLLAPAAWTVFTRGQLEGGGPAVHLTSASFAALCAVFATRAAWTAAGARAETGLLAGDSMTVLAVLLAPLAGVGWVLGVVTITSGRLRAAAVAAQATARESEERYRSLVETSPDMIYRADASGRFTYVNPAGLRFTGYSMDEVLATSWLDLIGADHRDAARDLYARQIRRRIPTTYFEFPAIAKDGRRVWIAQNVQLLYQGEEPSGFEAVARDITARRLAEVALRQQKDLLDGLVAVARATSEGNSLDATLRQTLAISNALTGATASSLLMLDESGTTTTALRTRGEATAPDPADVPLVMAGGLAGWVARHRQSVRVADTEKDDRWLHGTSMGSSTRSVLAVPISSGGALVGVLTLDHSEPAHFTESHQQLMESAAAQIALALRNAQVSEARLRLAEERQLLYEVLAVASQPREASEIARAATEVIARHTGWPHVVVALPDADGCWAFTGVSRPCTEGFRVHVGRGVLGRAFVTGRTQVVPDVSREPGYVAGWPETRSELAVPLRFGDRIQGVLNLESDRQDAFGAELVRQVESLAEAIAIGLENSLASRLREDLTHALVHDLRNPLTSVGGALELLVESVPASQRELCSMALKSARRLEALVAAILDVARLESGRMTLRREPLALASLVEEALDGQRLLARGRGVELVADVAPDLPLIAADGELLLRVLQNLVGNSVKFIPGGGRVVVSVGVCPDSAAVQVSVSDDGPGLPAEMAGRVFEKFAAGNQKGRGSGLGLAFCRLAVEAHGGRIQAHSRPGGGAVFSFTLPVVPSAAVAQAQLRTPPDATPGIGSTTRPLRVLVADDDAVSRKLAVMALMELGHQADEVDDGESALQALNERHYDVVLMDIEMQRLDGIDAARRIASEWAPERRPRIIAVTVSTRREDRERCLAAGMDDYVSKPLRLQTLARKLGRAPEPAAASMPVSPPGPCPIDAQRFAELELLDAAAPGALADLIVTFLQQARPQLELILAAVRAGDSPALRRAAHGFKGTCETIGAVALAAQCGQLETHADLAQARAVLPRLEREFELACAWLAAAPATTTPAA